MGNILPATNIIFWELVNAFLTKFNEEKMKIKSLYKSLVLLGLVCVGTDHSYAQKIPMYIGTYTSGSNSEGVYIYDLNVKSGTSSLKQVIPMSNPSFLARKGDILYAVNEDIQGKVTAYDLKNNVVLSQLETGGAHPCHVAYSNSLPILLVSNYSGGSLSLYSLEQNGAIRKLEQHIQYSSSSVNKERQNAAHIHSAFLSEDGKRAYVSDLGGDLIYEYAILKDGDDYKLEELSRIQTKLGGGPRHMSFGRGNEIIYSVLELTGEVEVFRNQNGAWKSIQVLPMFDTNFKGNQGAGDIKTSKNGKHVYATNRGDANVVLTYKVMKGGELLLENILSVDGNSPRNLNMTPNNKWLFIGNQESNAVSVFKIGKNGRLKLSAEKIQIPKPVCVVF